MACFCSLLVLGLKEDCLYEEKSFAVRIVLACNFLKNSLFGVCPVDTIVPCVQDSYGVQGCRDVC